MSIKGNIAVVDFWRPAGHDQDEVEFYISTAGDGLTIEDIDRLHEGVQEYMAGKTFDSEVRYRVVFAEYRDIDGGGALLDIHWSPDMEDALL